ncbi:MAG: hypothetical protein ACRECP_03530 [Methylocella sp.]
MQPMNDIDEDWREKRLTGPIYRKITLTDAGLMLGREIIHARPAWSAPAATGPFIDDGDKPRILALLAAAYGQPIADHAIAKMRRAAALWEEGEKALAQIHLAFIGLPDADEAVAYRLFLALKTFDSGLSPETLMKALGFERTALDVEKYNPDEPRVPAGSGRESGQWTSGDSGQLQTPQAAPLGVQVAQNITCSDFIAANCKGSVLRVFPGQYLDLPVDQVLSDAKAGVRAAQRAKKLLFNNRYRK